MNIMLLAGVRQLLPAPATSLVLLILLALGSFLASISLTSLELGILGVVLALAVPTISWIKQSLLFILIAVALVVGIAMTFGKEGRKINSCVEANLPATGQPNLSLRLGALNPMDSAQQLSRSRFHLGIVGREARMRCGKSDAPSAAFAALLIRDRRLSSSNGSDVSIRPDS
jgi:hypothetical protein